MASKRQTTGSKPAESPKPVTMRVVAICTFYDALTKRDYCAGDVVLWDAERAQRYAGELVRIEEAGGE